MRRENGIRKGLNRLLVLVLAAAITMAFSFTGVFAATLATSDDTSKVEGNNNVAVQGPLPTHKNNDPYTV